MERFTDEQIAHIRFEAFTSGWIGEIYMITEELLAFRKAIGTPEVAREAVEMLRALEWSGFEYDTDGDRHICCPHCEQFQGGDDEYQGHADVCTFAAILAKLPKGDGR